MKNKDFDLKLREKVFKAFPWGKIITTYDYNYKVTEVSFTFCCIDETIERHWSFTEPLINNAEEAIIDNIVNEIRRLVKNTKGEKQAYLAYYGGFNTND